jgi:hypothetical protein
VTAPEDSPVRFTDMVIPADLDVDLLIGRGRRRRARKLSAAVSLTVLAVAGAISGAFLAAAGTPSAGHGLSYVHHSPPPAHSSATVVTSAYTPFTANGAIPAGLTIRASGTGTCSSTGPVLPGTYTCKITKTDGHHADVGLCYPQPRTSLLLCVNPPTPKSAVKVQSTGSLPPPTTNPAGAPPPEIRLADGSTCGSIQGMGAAGRAFYTQKTAANKLFSTGKSYGREGRLKVSYECDGHTSVVFGPINKSGSRWTVQSRTGWLHGKLHTTEITQAWQ